MQPAKTILRFEFSAYPFFIRRRSMKIAVTSNGPSLDAVVEARFGRCTYFLCIDLDTLALEAIPNPYMALSGGAGPQSAQLMAEKGVLAVLTGNCGPNAFQAFAAAGIQVVSGVSGLVREAVDQFKAGRLKPASMPSVQGHYGTGGMGAGRGMGRGRGLGGGARRMR
jgi:predicted Fe-Mo cluster-binding NifX family protein